MMCYSICGPAMQFDDFILGLRKWQGMLENFPEYIDCQLRLAAIAARGGKRGEAQSHLRAILKQKPGNADALAFMGAQPWASQKCRVQNG